MFDVTQIKVKKTITTTTEHELALNNKDILEALHQMGYVIPDGAVASFFVPGGGDSSNMEIEIDDENPISINWTVTTEAETSTT
jgi:hypothetical protein